METLYTWLLLNTENAGNHYTILNTHRHGPDSLEVMARSSDFRIVNLFIQDTGNTDPPTNQPEQFSHKALKGHHVFSNEHDVIVYLATGQAPDPQEPNEATGFHVFVTEPDGEAGDVTFPPVQM